MHSAERDGKARSMVDRALALLTAFTPADAELSLAELSRRTGIPKPTVHRLLNELAPWGMVDKTPAGVRLGMGLFELGARAPAQLTLREAAGPALADLAEATRETVHLAVLQERDVVYVQKLPFKGGPSVRSRLGGRMPAYCTAVGKAMLAFSPPEVVHTALDGPLRRRTPYTVIAPGLIERELRAVREHGFAEEHEESTRGIACVAAPVVDRDGRASAAVSITGWADRIDTRRLAPAVRTAALGIGRALSPGPGVHGLRRPDRS
ncbi:IclR family transcriptional regulator [Streptomyces sp. NPDC001978]|uniref:IclR family transcriptional regulator n=1 Tax=Streptomyces sp. NPDC001978 TaxID=3364627 RepID=UPI0036907484